MNDVFRKCLSGVKAVPIHSRSVAVPLFIKSNILPISFLYVESVCNLMHNVKNKIAPANIQNLFRNVSDVHSYNTRSAAAGKLYIMHSRLELQKLSFSRFGARLWNNIPSNLKELNNKNFKKQIHKMLIKILEAEDQYLDSESIVKSISKFQP